MHSSKGGKHMDANIHFFFSKMGKKFKDNIKIAVLWDVPAVRSIVRQQSFEGFCCLHLQSPMEAVGLSETLIPINRIKRYHVTEDSDVNIKLRDDHKAHTKLKAPDRPHLRGR
jgi:hypothetical protein